MCLWGFNWRLAVPVVPDDGRVAIGSCATYVCVCMSYFTRIKCGLICLCLTGEMSLFKLKSHLIKHFFGGGSATSFLTYRCMSIPI